MKEWPKEVQQRYPIAVFLDRDGTINVDTHYAHRSDHLEVIPAALDGIRILATLPVHIAVVSNQAGIALGLYTVDQMIEFNAALRKEIERFGGRTDAFYYCPHKEQKDLAVGEASCECSKPRPGMLHEAARDLGINLESSYFIGDKSSDVLAGKEAGCTTVLLKTGKAGREEGTIPVDPDFIAKDLSEAANWVKERERKGFAAS